MKILLQNTHSQLFFRYGSVWTSNPEVAYDFRNPQAVFEHVQRESLGDVQLVVRFENPERYEVVPLGPIAAPTAASPLPAPAH